MRRQKRTVDPDWIDEVIAELPAICDAKQAMAALAISRRTLDRIVASGDLEAHKRRPSKTSKLIIPRAAIRRYLAGIAA